MPHAGEVIGGRYDLIAHLGDGGTASVWKAHDRTLQREVAIKFLYVVDERAIEDMRKQFLREARIACAVKHRNVIQTMDFGQTLEGRAYMVMELLHGEELSERMGREPALPLAEIIRTVGGILRGLSAIHEAGIVHRDLKPENVYLERDEGGVYPKILDFGVAKSVDRHNGSRRSVLTTKTGMLVGTPEYMSPEQARSQPDLDGRADVWSVGVILFELLTGILPFDAPSEAEVIVQIMTTEAPRLSDVQPRAPRALEAVVSKALQRDREQRFEGAAEMLQALLDAERAIETGENGGRQRVQRALLWSSGLFAVGLVAAWFAFTAGLLSQSSGPAPAQARAARPVSDVKVELRGVPESATVLVNGRPAKGTTLVLPDDGYARLIEVQAPGLAPWRVLHPAGNNAQYEVRMPAAPESPASAAPTAEVAGIARASVAESPPRAPPLDTKPNRVPVRPQQPKKPTAAGASQLIRNLDF